MNIKLHNFGVKILSLMILKKSKRKEFRKKYRKVGVCKTRTTIVGLNNIVDIPKIGKIKVDICGDNNRVCIKDGSNIVGNLNIHIFGDNNIIEIGSPFYLSDKLNILLGQNHPNFGNCSNCEVKIGSGTSFEEAEMIMYNCNSRILIGENCMFAGGIELYHTDAHPVFEVESGRIINKVKDMVIGDHCWIGMDACLLKNVHLPDDTIVGRRALVCSSFEEKNTAIGGNPAKVIKHNVSWAPRADGYIENEN